MTGILHKNLKISDEKAAEIIIEVYKLMNFNEPTIPVLASLKKLVEKYQGKELAYAVYQFAWLTAMETYYHHPHFFELDYFAHLRWAKIAEKDKDEAIKLFVKEFKRFDELMERKEII